MVYGNDYVGVPGQLNDYPASTGEVLEAGFDEAVSDNPFTKMLDYVELQTQTGGALDFVSGEAPRTVSKQDAEKRAREAGVVVHNIPEDGLNEPALALLVERQYQKKVRRQTIESAGGGFVNGSAELLGGFAGSMVDPLNIATSFIPVVGQARYASWLAKASGPMGRIGVRMGVGAAEGALGAALMEPLSYGFSHELGDDYTMANSLMNVAFGTALGGGLHSATGFIGDVRAGVGLADGPKFKSVTEWNGVLNKIKTLESAPPEVRLEYARAAIAQFAEDRHVNVNPLLEAHNADVATQIEAIDLKIAEAEAKGLGPEETARLQEQRTYLEEQRFDAKAEKASIEEAPKVDHEAKTLPEQKREILQEVKKVSKEISRISNEIDGLDKVKQAEVIKVKEAEIDGLRQKIDELATQKKELDVNSPRVSKPDAKAMADVHRNVKALSEDAPDSKFVDNKLEDSQRAELAKDPAPTQAVEEVDALITEDMAMLKEDADQLGIDLKENAEIKAADELIDLREEEGKMLRAMAICASRIA